MFSFIHQTKRSTSYSVGTHVIKPGIWMQTTKRRARLHYKGGFIWINNGFRCISELGHSTTHLPPGPASVPYFTSIEGSRIYILLDNSWTYLMNTACCVPVTILWRILKIITTRALFQNILDERYFRDVLAPTINILYLKTKLYLNSVH